MNGNNYRDSIMNGRDSYLGTMETDHKQLKYSRMFRRNRVARFATFLIFFGCSFPLAIYGDPTTTPTLAGGGLFTIFMKSNGTLWTVGDNASGQLGNGTTNREANLTQLVGSVAACSAGFAHTLFIKTDRSLWGTGDNFYGELGDYNQHHTPYQITTGVRSVTAGESHTLFIKQNGTLWAMGDNYYGQLGDGSGMNQFAPVQIATGVQGAAAGQDHSFFIKNDGTLWAMGDNGYGDLGDGTTTERDTPVMIASNVKKVSAGFEFSFFLKNDGTLWSMGYNSYGQLGDGTLMTHHLPTQVASGIQDVSCGQYHTLFLTTAGNLYGVGWNTNGQLAVTDPPGSNGYHPTPVAIASNVRAIAAGDLHSLFVTADGKLWAVGANGSGQLGDGGTTDQYIPENVATVAAILPSPAANAATSVISNSFTANWLSANDATGYRLDVSTNSSFSSFVNGYQNVDVGNAISHTVTGLSASTAYYYRVRAYNTAGTSGNSNTVAVTTLSATGSPLVTANSATNVASFSATLNGSVYPHGLSTTVYFQYGTTTGYGLTTAAHSYAGNIYQNVAANVSGLGAATTYHFRIVAINSAGTTYGTDRAFTTLSATGPPVVTSSSATYVASFSATLNGSLDPHGLTTNVYFQYGATTGYGLTTAAQSQTGDTYRNVSASIGSLNASTIYHFRIVATNSAGTRYGSDMTFTTLTPTGPPIVTTNPANNVGSSLATLNGSLDPHGLITSVYFQYGTTSNYGLTTAAQSQTGNTYHNVAAGVGGLSAGTIYHFRIVATNSSGARYGGDRTFTTH
jgi:alpha-tubulin suppressor-like RCC1 family protein